MSDSNAAGACADSSARSLWSRAVTSLARLLEREVLVEPGRHVLGQALELAHRLRGRARGRAAQLTEVEVLRVEHRAPPTRALAPADQEVAFRPRRLAVAQLLEV